jgi:predicted lipoprotein with Yx(FWY)xxD motif
MLRLSAALVVAPAVVSVAAAAPPRTKLGVRATQLGKVLVDGRGHTVYVFDKATCTGACASTWPPFITSGKPVAAGVPAAKVGTKKLAGGKLQVTFGGKRLYFYVGDSGAGQVAGASVAHWAALSPSGGVVHASVGTTTTPTMTDPYPGGDGY